MIYLDHHATTPVDPQVLQRMLPFFAEDYGNAASRNHAFGWKAEEAAEVARQQVGDRLEASSREIVFTSGATESNNLAILGVARQYREKGRHLITQATEHKAVLDPMSVLEGEGYEVTRVPVDRSGRVDPESIKKALRPDTILISVMMANNEIGTLQPMAEIGALGKQKGVLVHSDAAQAGAYLPLAVDALGVDLVSLSAHKMYGPKGVGALYVRRRDPRVQLIPLLHGGGHERGLRSGTLNVPAVVGFGEACRLAQTRREEDRVRVSALRDRFQAEIMDRLSGVIVNGHQTERHPGNLHLTFDGVDGEALLMSLKDLAVSSGAACASATLQPSHVMAAIGVNPAAARRSLRFGFGRTNTEAEIDRAVAQVEQTVRRLRA